MAHRTPKSTLLTGFLIHHTMTQLSNGHRRDAEDKECGKGYSAPMPPPGAPHPQVLHIFTIPKYLPNPTSEIFMKASFSSKIIKSLAIDDKLHRDRGDETAPNKPSSLWLPRGFPQITWNINSGVVQRSLWLITKKIPISLLLHLSLKNLQGS